MIDIRATYKEVMTAQIASIGDPKLINNAGAILSLHLGQLHHMAQTVEVVFAQYQEIRSAPNFDPEQADLSDYSSIIKQPYQPLSKRINDLAKADPNCSLLGPMRIFSNFRGWTAHKMTVTFLPVLHQEALANHMIPLVKRMTEYAAALASSISQHALEWMSSHLPENHDKFTNETAQEFASAVQVEISQLMPSHLELPQTVTIALRSSGFWPYDQSPGNKGMAFDVDEEGRLLASPL